jgi:hypothetical protein
MNNEFAKDIAKSVKSADMGSGAELTPGATGRRYEPVGGVAAHNKRIHTDSQYADHHKNLPFSFSKPKKAARGKVYACANCGKIVQATVNTVGIVCRGCNQYSKVEEIDNV